MLMVVDHIPFFSWFYKRAMFVKLYVTVVYKCVYGNLISFRFEYYIYRIHLTGLYLFTGTDHRLRITNRWYVRNHVISNVLKKTKLFSFNTSTVTFFLAVSNLLPRGSQEPQLPPSPRKVSTVISPEPGTLGSHYLHSTEIQSHPFYTPKITRFHTRELCVFGPYLCLFDPAAAARGRR